MPYTHDDFAKMNKAQLIAKHVTRNVRTAYDDGLAKDKAEGDSNIKVTLGPRAIGWSMWEGVKSPITFAYGLFDSKDQLVQKCDAKEKALVASRAKLKA